MRKLLYVFLLTGPLLACAKKSSPAGEVTNGNDTTKIITPVDPAVAATTGFFLDGWQPLAFTAPASKPGSPPATANVNISVDAGTVIARISPALFGNNANPYMTQMVTEPVLLQHIRNLHPGIIRFPGGNISSVFFWNTGPGQTPADAPAHLRDADGKAIDPGYWYGNNSAAYTLSLANYYNMLSQTGNEGIITINYGYARYGLSADPVAAAAHLAAEWVRYDKGRTRYWEIGNESNGTWQAGYRIAVADNKDGQPEIITGELYGRHFKVFADSMRKAAAETGAKIFIGVQLLEKEPASWANATDKGWNSGVLTQAASAADYYIVHSYFTPYLTNATPAEILTTGSTGPTEMLGYIDKCRAQTGTAAKPVALTEWNIFSSGAQQMVSQVAGVHAVIVLEELMRQQFGMASRWDLANGWNNGDDHGLFSQGEVASGESRWAPRPAFYYMWLLRKTLGDRCIPATVGAGAADVLAYASSFSNGALQVVLVNKGNSAVNAGVAFKNFKPGAKYYWYTLSGESTGFTRKVVINGEGPAGSIGGPADYTNVKAYVADAGNGVRVNVPAMSVTILQIGK